MAEAKPGRRDNQRLRTRKDLLEAAARLVRQRRHPTLEEVAAEALVSRATAYRHFASIEALLLEASLDIAFPEPEALFGNAAGDDPVRRVQQAEAAVADMVASNETALRMMLIQSLQYSLRGGGEGPPARQNRRTPLIEAALAPARRRFGEASYDRLVKSLALVIGTEAMLVFKDVLGLGDEEAGAVKAWVIRALVDAALGERA
jgi:AcrR family transcriptional regulator